MALLLAARTPTPYADHFHRRANCHIRQHLPEVCTPPSSCVSCTCCYSSYSCTFNSSSNTSTLSANSVPVRPGFEHGLHRPRTRPIIKRRKRPPLLLAHCAHCPLEPHARALVRVDDIGGGSVNIAATTAAAVDIVVHLLRFRRRGSSCPKNRRMFQ